MTSLRKTLLTYLPLIIGLAILAVAIPLVPWHQVWPALRHVSLAAWLMLLALSALYYLGRIVRYWLMLRLLDQPAEFGKVALACLVAQPVAVLPGGELYRGTMLKRYANVSLSHGLPSVFAQSVAESVGLLLIALLGVSVLRQYLVVLIIVAAIFAGVWAVIRWHSPSLSHRLVNKLPGVSIHHHRVRSFLGKNRDLLTGRNFFLLLAASFISTIAGIGMMYVGAHSLGASLSPFQAAMAYALPTVLETVSFLPGGLGVNEQGSVGILVLFGLTVPLAVALTLMVRVFTLGIGFAYGFAALGWARWRQWRRYDD
jgi:uncharacterized protein (TIRG00374 family)